MANSGPLVDWTVLTNPARLAAVERISSNSCSTGPAFGQLTRLAKHVLEVRDAFVSLVLGQEQQLITDSDLTESPVSTMRVPLSHSFCRFVVSTGKPLIISNASRHPLVSHSPAISENNVQAYAGVPLTVSDGLVVGCFCAVDGKPRWWTAKEIKRLKLIADLVTAEIRAAHEAQEELEESERRFHLLAENAREVISRHTPDGTFLYASPACRRVLGYEPGELVGTLPTDLVAPEDVDLVRDTLRHLQSSPVARTITVRVRTKTGNGISLEVTSRAVRDVRGAVVELHVSSKDVTEQKRVESELANVVNRDALTGLFNRRGFFEELRRIADAAGSRQVRGWIMRVDLDHFTELNEVLGSGMGDEVLTEVASLVRRHVGADDVLARVGGDEFALLLSEAPRQRAQAAAARLLQSVGKKCFGPDGSWALDACIGIAGFPDDAATPIAAMELAGLALGRAKSEGPGQLAVYDGAFDRADEKLAHLALQKRLREALVDESFCLLAQPIQDLRTDRVSHFELLIRLVEPDGQFMLPMKFIPLAEETGQIIEIDKWVVRSAIEFLQRRPGGGFSVSVNLSAKSLSGTGVLSQLQAAATTIEPGRLILEITETAAMENILKATRFMKTARSLGYQFALDDFGVGFSSFYELKHLPVDYVKIDGGFVKNMVTDESDRILVKAIAEASRGLGKLVVAEWASDQDTLALLKDLSVDYAQGWAVGKPGHLETVVGKYFGDGQAARSA